ncbi:MAG: hypothetical protein KDI51_14445, partial [Xanthomonadales bacterium]|nr:hypothetical protein [Xanthomonadales bacterium]
RLKRERPRDKVLLFSFFRGTLAYLHRRLGNAGFNSVMVRGGDDKEAIVERFRADASLQVMLSTEVMAEGVDLQFMRVLINYDLPWNPMRVEQRIGRMDRIGQEAETISVFNLVLADTVDDKIQRRLFQRLKLFEDTLGCAEQVLGDVIAKLTRDLLRGGLTPEQEESRIDQAGMAIEENRRAMLEVEESAADLVGLADYVRDRVIKAHQTERHIDDGSLVQFLRDFLEHEAPGHRFRLDSDGSLRGELMLPAPLALDLQAFCEHHRMRPSRLASHQSVKIVIRNHVNAPNLATDCELINQFHPLIKLAAHRSSDRDAEPLVHAVTLSDHVPSGINSGIYAIAAERWGFEGVRKDVSLSACFIRLDGKGLIEGDEAFDLLNTLRAHGRDWIDASVSIEVDAAIAGLECARRKLAARFANHRRAFQAENVDRARLQLASIESSFERRRQQLEAQIARHHAAGSRLEAADRKRLENLTNRFELQKEKIERSNRTREEKRSIAEGIARIES